ncbi:alpha/beta hydrolase [Geodermatophilus sp. YIM 151500]|uniref:alpha/beta hydrolase n=1 Tax=Geodermatophilus sp. YIM 151500 TaxID=2984531 RepID=UPI0021E47C68|nr:alpha/beta hydrolase [Geodermatophilus sp. YIM 151500]
MSRRAAVVGVALAVSVPVGASGAAAGPAAPSPAPSTATVPDLAWVDCGLTEEATAAGVQCATAGLPLDHDDPDGEQVQIAVAKAPATAPDQRIGSLFFNFGGPGAPSVYYLQRAGAGFLSGLNERFDLVAFDPRGTGQSTPGIDCGVDQETTGIYSSPFPTPLDIDVDAYMTKVQTYVDACLESNGPILEHVSTANVARDLDLLRAAVGDEKLSYLGFSYGTFLGATYAALFPENHRALVLDGPIDAEGYINDPLSNLAEQTAGFELALSRFFEACAADQEACSGFGGESPSQAYDALVAAADAEPLPADGYEPNPEPVSGDSIRTATSSLLYAERAWGALAAALVEAAAGDGSSIRAIVDASYGREEDGTYSNALDLYFAIGASEQRYPKGDVDVYLDRGSESWASFPHFWRNSGYAELNYGLWPVHDEDSYAGPFTVDPAAPAPLVVNTTYDPATPYPGGLRLVADLGNARLLTMDGDGHTAYGGKSTCVDAAVEDYLVELALPEPGTVCEQEVPFVAPEEVTAGSRTAFTWTGVLVGRR